MKVIQDTPVSKIIDDKLGRENIVDLVVDSINAHVKSDHSCLVYGVYGKWGEGKTSLLNFIEEKLLDQGANDNVNIIKFNPWLVNNDETLLREFFMSMTSCLDDKTRAIFEKYGSLAILASKTVVNAFLPGFGSALAEGIGLAKEALKDSTDTLSETKKKVSDAIIKSKRHLVIMIDDVDRLDKEELHSVLRLIRQVADFDNCMYIVAMDIDIVSKSISSYYGTGNPQDGRRFVDKIVQVPITLPYIPNCNMQRIVEDELSDVLDDYVDQVAKFEIALAVTPFFSTYRELKRYCNQLQFVLPHLREEVNIHDLCLLEAIKSVNAESYHRIYEHRSQLLREVSNVYYMKNEESRTAVEQMCQEAKDSVVEGLSGNVKKTILSALDVLFEKRTLYDDKYITEKRINTAVYFAKYFVQTVPSDLIPDRLLEDFKERILEMPIPDMASIVNDWSLKYTLNEVKRAALYAINHSDTVEHKCKIASQLAKALSVSIYSKDVPPHAVKGGDSVAMFVLLNVLRFTRTRALLNEQHEKGGDYGLYEDALKYIFENAEMNYAMGVYYDLHEEIFGSKGVFDIVMPVLIGRFKELSFNQQFEYSGTLLIPLFYGWKKYDSKSWDEFVQSLLVDDDTSCITILEKFIQDKRDGEGISVFLNYFRGHIETFNEKLTTEADVANNDIVKSYFANYKQLLKELK